MVFFKMCRRTRNFMGRGSCLVLLLLPFVMMSAVGASFDFDALEAAEAAAEREGLGRAEPVAVAVPPVGGEPEPVWGPPEAVDDVGVPALRPEGAAAPDVAEAVAPPEAAEPAEVVDAPVIEVALEIPEAREIPLPVYLASPYPAYESRKVTTEEDSPYPAIAAHEVTPSSGDKAHADEVMPTTASDPVVSAVPQATSMATEVVAPVAPQSTTNDPVLTPAAPTKDKKKSVDVSADDSTNQDPIDADTVLEETAPAQTPASVSDAIKKQKQKQEEEELTQKSSDEGWYLVQATPQSTTVATPSFGTESFTSQSSTGYISSALSSPQSSIGASTNTTEESSTPSELTVVAKPEPDEIEDTLGLNPYTEESEATSGQSTDRSILIAEALPRSPSQATRGGTRSRQQTNRGASSQGPRKPVVPVLQGQAAGGA